MSTPLSFRAAAITDIGRVRRQNEDRFICDEARGVFGVADGVGGLPAGAQAARAAMNSLAESIATATPTTATAWRPLVEAANTAVVAKGKEVGGRLGIATTLTVGAISGTDLLLAHIGDSRCLLHREGKSICLTTDHSAENEAKLDASLPAPPAKWRLALARCLGQPEGLNPDFLTHSLRPGDLLLFATDGITRVTGEEEIFACLTGSENSLSERLAGLIELTHARGAPDNATAVLVEIPPDSHD